MKNTRSTNGDRPELLQHLKGARTLARRLVRDASEAQDVSQDAACLALARDADQVSGGWLHGAIRNLVMQRERQGARRRHREREAARDERAADHGEMLAAVESHRRLVDHVLALDERDRDVLLWRYFHGESSSEIARHEGRTVAAVSNQLTRAHRSLRRRLESDGGRDHWLGGLAPLVGWAGAKSSPWPVASGLLASGGFKIAAGCAAAVLCAGLYWFLDPGSGGAPPGGSAAPPPLASPSEEIAALPPKGQAPVGNAPPRQSRIAAETRTSKEAGAALHGRVQDARRDPLTNPRVTLRAPDGNVFRPAAAGPSPGWSGLPTGVPLDVLLEVDGTQWPEPIAEVSLLEGEAREVTWTVHARTLVRGVAVDQDGAPLPLQLVNLHRAWKAEASFAAQIEESSDMGTTLTDSAGRFVFAPVPPGEYQLMGRTQASWVTENELAADGRVTETELEGRITSKAPCSAWTQPLVIPVNTESLEPTLVLFTGGEIQGQIVSGITGEPVSGKAAVQIEAMSSFGFTHGETASDGTFTSPPLPRGRFRLRVASAPSGWILGAPVEASSGDESVLIPVLPAAIVEVRVDAGSETFSGKGKILAKALRPKTPQPRPFHWLEASDPKATLSTLPPGSYAILFTSEDQSLAGLIHLVDLGPGELPGGLVLQARRSAFVRVEAAEETLFVTANVGKVEFDLCRVRPGRSDTLCLPSGPITLRISRGNDPSPIVRTIELESGAVHVVR